MPSATMPPRDRASQVQALFSPRGAGHGRSARNQRNRGRGQVSQQPGSPSSAFSSRPAPVGHRTDWPPAGSTPAGRQPVREGLHHRRRGLRPGRGRNRLLPHQVPGTSRRTDPVQIHGHTRAEAIWTIIPAVILAGVAIPTVKLIFDFAKAPRRKPHRRLRHGSPVVVAVRLCHQVPRLPARPAPRAPSPRQRTAHPGGQTHLPHAQLDRCHPRVLGSKLNGKQDVVPGHTNHMTIEADARDLLRPVLAVLWQVPRQHAACG